MNVVLMMLETTLTLRKRGLCLRDWGQPGQNEQALAEWAPQLWEADTQKLARLVRNYGIETVNAATMARGVHRAILRYYERRHSLPTWWCRYCGVRDDRPARVEGSDHRL